MDIQTVNNISDVNYTTQAYTDKSNLVGSRQETQNMVADDANKDASKAKQKEAEQKIIEGIEEASGKIEAQYKELKFSIHKDTKRIMVKVVDKETKEVLREIPPEKVLDIMAKVEKNAGLYIDEKR